MAISIGKMIEHCAGLIDTKDVSDWEDEFLQNIVERTENGKRTSALSEKQVQVVERIYRKHFAQ